MFERLVFIEISVRANKMLFDVSRPRSWCRPKPSFSLVFLIRPGNTLTLKMCSTQRRGTKESDWSNPIFRAWLWFSTLSDNFNAKIQKQVQRWRHYDIHLELFFSINKKTPLFNRDPDYFPWETGITASTRRNSQKNSGKCYRDVSEYHKPRYNNFVLTGWLVSKTVLRILTVYCRCARVTWIKSLTVFLIAGY